MPTYTTRTSRPTSALVVRDPLVWELSNDAWLTLARAAEGGVAR